MGEMIETTIKIYKCPHCGTQAAYQHAHNVDACKTRLNSELKRMAEYEAYVAEVKKKSKALAAQSEPIRLLLQHGYRDDARVLADRLYSDNFSWDPGCSHAMEGLIDSMLEAARQAIPQADKLPPQGAPIDNE